MKTSPTTQEHDVEDNQPVANEQPNRLADKDRSATPRRRAIGTRKGSEKRRLGQEDENDEGFEVDYHPGEEGAAGEAFLERDRRFEIERHRHCPRSGQSA